MSALIGALTKFNKGEISGEEVLDFLCMHITDSLGVSRASIWLMAKDESSIECIRLFDSGSEESSSGAVLTREDFAPYFDAIQNGQVLIASDAMTDPRTECFAESYFKEHDIHSLMDVSVPRDRKRTVIMCCENCHEQRNWTSSDVHFLAELKSWVMIATADYE